MASEDNPSEIENSSKPLDTVEDKIVPTAVLNIEKSGRKINESLLLFMNDTTTKNSVQFLNEFCATLGETVTYDVSIDISGLYSCRVKIDGNEVEFKGSSKKISKAGAAKAMIYKLIGHENAGKIFQNVSVFSALTEKSAINFVGKVQEFCTEKHLSLPTYQLQVESGKPPNVSFLMNCTLGDKSVVGEGRSKKLAKQCAAEEMWKILMVQQGKENENPDAEHGENSNNLETDAEKAKK